MKKIYSLIILALGATGLSAQITEDFESLAIGDQVASVGWGTQAASIADDIVSPGTGNNVLKFLPGDYNAGPIIEFTIPAGNTLADYNSFKFDAFFEQGDVGWKNIIVEAYAATPSGGSFQAADVANQIGTWNRAQGGSTAWESIDIPINQNDAYSATLSGTIYIVFGINCAGTGAIGGTAVETIWYADDVTLSPGVSTLATAPKAEAKVSTTPGTINIVPQMGSKVVVYALSGTKVFSQDNTAGNITVTVAPGLYIVVVDKTSTKVVVK